MRFYRLPLAEIMSLTMRQLYYLGGRISVYEAEDTLRFIEMASFPHMKAGAQRDVVARFRAIIDADNMQNGIVDRDIDREGLAALKATIRGNRKKR